MNKLFLENSISQLTKKIEKKDINPSDLISATLENIKEFDKKYHAWVTYGDEKIFEKERKENKLFEGKIKQPLLNIPIGVKDIFNTNDYLTQMGSPLWKNFSPGNDARVVFNLRRQGAIVVGKTVTAEFAVHTLNETINPYDKTKTPGTSSSGSAVAISLGMVPITTGSQTAGSIVRPASFCGVYGCKPSFGMIPRTGTLKTTDSLDTLGFLTIHRKDLKIVFDSMRISGPDYPIINSALSDFTRQTKKVGIPWRVGFVKTHTWQYAPQYAKNDIEKFIAKLSKQKDVQVTEAELPDSMLRTHVIHETIYNKSLSYYFKGEHKKSVFVSGVMNELIENGDNIKIDDYKKAIQFQNQLIKDMDLFFKDYDVLISLSTAGEAPLRNVAELPDPALMWTLSHLPVVGVPNFISPDRLPFGMQVVARKYNDYLLFSFLDYMESIRMIPSQSMSFLDNHKKLK
jgi:Asp-tRNA(Asn)/Glu-tRNA(Gln) amidotransferase A subunit family amidase